MRCSELRHHLKAVCLDNRVRLIARRCWPNVRLDHSLRTLTVPFHPARADYFLALVNVGSVRSRDRHGTARPAALEQVEGLQWALGVSRASATDTVVEAVTTELMRELPMLFTYFQPGRPAD